VHNCRKICERSRWPALPAEVVHGISDAVQKTASARRIR
jgi:hypothetical protein